MSDNRQFKRPSTGDIGPVGTNKKKFSRLDLLRIRAKQKQRRDEIAKTNAEQYLSQFSELSQLYADFVAADGEKTTVVLDSTNKSRRAVVARVKSTENDTAQSSTATNQPPQHLYQKVPRYIRELVVDMDLLSEPNHNVRAQRFLRALYQSKMLGSTAIRHFERLKPLCFPHTDLVPDTIHFDRLVMAQQRLPDSDVLVRFVGLVCTNVGDSVNLKWIILWVYYTGLRKFEILSLTGHHVQQLLERRVEIDLLRKNGGIWRPVYHGEFTKFLRQFTTTKFYTAYRESVVSGDTANMPPIFIEHPDRLHRRLCALYVKLMHVEPVYGFGLHSFRYFVATQLGRDKVTTAQDYLGHKNLKTTYRYIRQDYTKLDRQLDRLTRDNVLYQKLLKPQQLAADNSSGRRSAGTSTAIDELQYEL